MAEKTNKVVRPSKKNKTVRSKKEDEVNRPRKRKKINVPKKKNKVGKVLIFIVFLLLLIGFAYYLTQTDTFNITNIVVEGNDKVSIEEISLNSNINIGDNLFVSLFMINRNNISKIPYVGKVSVSFKLPHTYIIKIAERDSIYFVYNSDNNMYYKLDIEGFILEECDRIELKNNELLVHGITFDDEVIIGSKINEIDYTKLVVYKQIEKECNQVLPYMRITKVSFTNSLTHLYLDDRINLILPNNTDLTYNLNLANSILETLGDVSGTLDMTKENPTFINF